MRSFLLYSQQSWRELRVSGNFCVEEQLLFVSKGTAACVLFVKEESESPQSGIFANSEGGVLNILPGTVPPLVQCS